VTAIYDYLILSEDYVGESWWQIEKKMEVHCSTGQTPQWAVVPMEEEVYIMCD